MKFCFHPNWTKWTGVILAFGGVIMAILTNVQGIRIEAPVFAIVSSFLETRYFVSFRTNIADELTLLLLVGGALLIFCSAGRHETELSEKLRTKALYRAILANSVFLLLSIVFTYGAGFFVVLILNTFSFFIFYFLIYALIRRKAHRKTIMQSPRDSEGDLSSPDDFR